jgi:hypothetical protein
MGTGLAAARETTMAAQERSLKMLREAATMPDSVAASVNQAAWADATLRCAVPGEEDISAGYDADNARAVSALLAVDGSHALASRHEELMFAVINIGTVIMRPGSARAPQVLTDTRLLVGDQLYAADGRLLSEGDVALARDAAERLNLLANAPEVPDCLALCDGPLELWGAKDVSDPRAFEQSLRKYLDALRELQRRGCIVAGYVDKPSADLVVRMLELPKVGLGAAPASAAPARLRGATDRWLFGNILQTAQRSAVFGLQSSSRERYGGDLALDFFYLNVGRPGQPAMARIEVPRWVARDRGRLDTVHRALLDQCALLGGRPYPYVLHRAHETASISDQEREQIKLKLILELRSRGLEPESVSGKASAKSLSARRWRS